MAPPRTRAGGAAAGTREVSDSWVRVVVDVTYAQGDRMQDQDEQSRDRQGRDEQEARRTTAPTPGAMVGITIPTTSQDDPVGGGDHE